MAETLDLVAGVVVFGLPIWLALYTGVKVRCQGYRPSRRPPQLPQDYWFNPASSTRFSGGERIGRRNATLPFASLVVDGLWAAIFSAGWTLPPGRGRIGTVWINRSVVVRVRRIGPLISPGIRFDTADGRYDGVVFWTFKHKQVVRAFARYGWPVDPAGHEP